MLCKICEKEVRYYEKDDIFKCMNVDCIMQGIPTKEVIENDHSVYRKETSW